MIIDKGIVEIDGKRTAVTREDIRKLKSILDEFGIMYIIDNVTCFNLWDAGERIEEFQDGRKREDNNHAPICPMDGFDQKEPFEFRELTVPSVLEIDYISLTQLDYEEAEFLGDLLLGAES